MDLRKKVLSETALFYGHFKMPKAYEKDWYIDRDTLAADILVSETQGTPFPYSKVWDMLNTYIREHMQRYHKIGLSNIKFWGNIYKPNEISKPKLHLNYANLDNSPDWVSLYGVKVEECMIRLYYDDNKRKGLYWEIPLRNNEFIIFPSTCMYYLTNHQKESLNLVQTTTYEEMKF